MPPTAPSTVFVDASAAPGGDGSPQRPAATLAQAVELARRQHAKHITLAPGNYFDTSVTLDDRDNGLTIEGQGATLYGGRCLEMGSREGNLLYCPLSAEMPVRLLLVDGALAKRARFPHSGMLQHTSEFAVPWRSTTEGGWQREPTAAELTTMAFKPSDLPRSLSARNAEVTVYHMWDESCVPVASIDFENAVMRFAVATGHPAGAFGVKKYVVWNTREGLGEGGSFYHDRENARIVYRLRAGETPSRLIAATQPTIIALRASRERPLENITITGLRLQVTTAPLVPGGFGALAFGGAIDLRGCHGQGIHLRDLAISHCAGYGIASGRNELSNSRVEDCTVEHCGAGGICVRGQRITLRRNTVRQTGLYFPSGVAIYAGGNDCVVEDNQIEDCSYSGIVCSGDRNAFRRNVIVRAMRDLFDGGALYVTFARDNVIEENICREITGPGEYHRAGYYLDEQTENTIVRRNIATNVDVPLQNHMTRSCVLEENVMVNEGDLRIHAARCEGLSLRGNIASAGGTLRVSGVNAYNSVSDNVVFSRTCRYEFITLDKYQPATTNDEPPAGMTKGDTETAARLANRGMQARDTSV